MKENESDLFFFSKFGSFGNDLNLMKDRRRAERFTTN